MKLDDLAQLLQDLFAQYERNGSAHSVAHLTGLDVTVGVQRDTASGTVHIDFAVTVAKGG